MGGNLRLLSSLFFLEAIEDQLHTFNEDKVAFREKSTLITNLLELKNDYPLPRCRTNYTTLYWRC